MTKNFLALVYAYTLQDTSNHGHLTYLKALVGQRTVINTNLGL